MAIDAAIELLRARVERLDSGPLPVGSFDADRCITRFVLVMESYTNTTFSAKPGDQVRLSPAEADAVTSTCQLLDSIARTEAALVTGPMDKKRQHWTATSRYGSSSKELSKPTRPRFIDIDERATIDPNTKPFELGLYTSTATRQGHSMWRTYLEINRGSSLHPLPWYTWEIQISPESASVLEVTTAREWVEFVEMYPSIESGMIYPDWHRVAADVDGIHLTARAIAAIQGFNFLTPHGVTAATYWDIESTLWLRWCFGSVDLCEVTR